MSQASTAGAPEMALERTSEVNGLERFWQCAGWSSDIDHDPVIRIVLGRPIVLFRRESGQIVALDDRCPHRFAPLHRGRRVGDGIACPYHGLIFNSVGECVHNPHGSGAIPPLARVRAYKVCEVDGAIWIWCGIDADLKQSKPPTHTERDPASGLHTVTGYLKVDAHFSLVIDNLLDLTHAGYLHPTTVSVPASERTPEVKSGIEAGVIFSHFLTRDVQAPGPYRPHYGDGPCDYHRDVRWLQPSTVRTLIGVSPPGRPIEEGIWIAGYHILTPEMDMTTHYHWSASRNFALDDAAYDERLREIVDTAFMLEDEPMIAACQRYMGTTDLFSLRPALLETDRPSVLMHRQLKRLVSG